MNNTIMEYALSLASAGFAVLPPKPGTKRPIAPWGEYQTKAPSLAKIKLWYLQEGAEGLGIITGKVSGYLEVIDFDDMPAYQKALQWCKDHPKVNEILKMVLQMEERSPKGMHWYYRVHNNSYPNEKLVQQREKDGSLKCVIETRGEGGYIIAAPTVMDDERAYTLTRGRSHLDAPTITAQQRHLLIDHLKALSESKEVAKERPQEIFVAPEGTNRPGDAYERQQSWEELLAPQGWTIFDVKGDTTQWCKPNAQDRHCHATTGHTTGFYVFSTNAAPFEAGKSYSKFAVYTLLEHNGNFVESAAELSRQGYGGDDLHRWAMPVDPSTPIDDRLGIKTLINIRDSEYPPVQYICYDILPEGLVVLAGAPKIGKSLFALDLCMTVGGDGGRKFLNKYDIKPDIECLYFALEDNERRLNDRVKMLEEMQPAWSDARHVITARSKATTQAPPTLDKGFCNMISEYLKENPKCKLIIVDVYNCIKPTSSGKQGGNAYEVDARQADALQQLALAHHCCILVLTHLRKSGANGRSETSDPFEEITGSMGLPSKADTVMVFKKGINNQEGKLYVRGRETREQTLDLDFVNGLWYVKDYHNLPEVDQEEAKDVKYLPELQAYMTESAKEWVTPREFGNWYNQTFGAKLTNPYMVMKRLYARNCLNFKSGKYAIR